jgi:Arc/MetJ family transcription regulator
LGFNKPNQITEIPGERVMKTSLNLPDELVKEAMELTEVKTKTKVIVLALQELIKKKQSG